MFHVVVSVVAPYVWAVVCICRVVAFTVVAVVVIAFAVVVVVVVSGLNVC
jgi:hypothetical protein